MTNDQFLLRYITLSVEENKSLWKQCVAFNKLYATEVQGIQLWSFNGSAKKATYKKWGTYDPDKFIKLQVGTAPLMRGDHLIQDFDKHWHIGIVRRVDTEGYYLLEQNNWELDKKYGERGDGDWKRNDAILIRYYRRQERPILLAFRKR